MSVFDHNQTRVRGSCCDGVVIRFFLAVAIIAGPSAIAQPGVSAGSHFAPVYQILRNQCAGCHHVGGASSWVVDMSPTADKYSGCLVHADLHSRHQCTTHQQLVEVPGPGIPAWVRPEQAASSEPYVNACVTEESFHIGVSLPEKLPDQACKMIFDWITRGAHY